MKLIFWNVDTQYDFMRNDESFEGALAIPGAREIEGNLEKLTRFAEQNMITVVNTADWHTIDSLEFSKTPDYKTTFPPHCLRGTKGAGFVPATRPSNAYVIDWQQDSISTEKLVEKRNIVIYKNAFDVFQGNLYTERVVNILKPERAVVYGVATNVCVDYAIIGLLRRSIKVYVPIDAIKELPGIDLYRFLKGWENAGAVLTKTEEVVRW